MLNTWFSNIFEVADLGLGDYEELQLLQLCVVVLHVQIECGQESTLALVYAETLVQCDHRWKLVAFETKTKVSILIIESKVWKLCFFF